MKIEKKFKQTWYNMKCRCNGDNKNYKGIKYLKRWSNYKLFKEDLFKEFKSHYKENNGDTTLERLNYDKNYSNTNCTFRTIEEQQRNRRNNINITYRGNTQCLAEWSRSLNLNYITLFKRLKEYGWTSKQTLDIPIRKYHNYK